MAGLGHILWIYPTRCCRITFQSYCLLFMCVIIFVCKCACVVVRVHEMMCTSVCMCLCMHVHACVCLCVYAMTWSRTVETPLCANISLPACPLASYMFCLLFIIIL